MNRRHALTARLVAAVLCGVMGFASGCGQGNPKGESAGKTVSGTAEKSRDEQDQSLSSQGRIGVRKSRRPLFAGNTTSPASLTTRKNAAGRSASQVPATAMLHKLQIIVGHWRGITRKALAGARGVEEPSWRWDFSTPGQPALAFESKSSSYLTRGRITWLAEKNEFRLVAATRAGKKKTYRGRLSEPIRDEPGEDGKTLDRKFKLTFEQIDPPPMPLEQNYRIDFQQLHNNRYYLIVHRKAGETVREWDRVANQRSGTSFAARLDDYGEKTCVVSQGLGTMTVSYHGKTYYVCCSGCKKAFEAEPEKWISRFQKWKRQQAMR